VNFIINASLYNVIGVDSTKDISFDKRVTILTGYNGCGKTTILRCIHETVSLYNNGVFANPRKGWAIEVNFNGKFKIRNYSLPSDRKEIKLEEHNYFSERVKVDAKLKDGYQIIFNKLSPESVDNKNKKDQIKLTKDFGRSARNNGLIQLVNKDKNEDPYLTILFCDELFYFNGEGVDNEKIRLEELDVYSRANNLSKTLYMLLQSFSKHSILSENDKNANKTLIELKRLLPLVPVKIRDQLEVNIKALEDDYGRKDIKDFMIIVNQFFNLTKREALIDGEGLICLSFGDDIVKWYDLSKGEKTLLSLLLVVYLNKDKKVTFLFDEPDLSLHIKWQRILIERLASIAPSCQFIISTHSPALIGNFSDQKIVNISAMFREQ